MLMDEQELLEKIEDLKKQLNALKSHVKDRKKQRLFLPDEIRNKYSNEPNKEYWSCIIPYPDAQRLSNIIRCVAYGYGKLKRLDEMTDAEYESYCNTMDRILNEIFLYVQNVKEKND